MWIIDSRPLHLVLSLLLHVYSSEKGSKSKWAAPKPTVVGDVYRTDIGEQQSDICDAVRVLPVCGSICTSYNYSDLVSEHEQEF